MPDSYNKYNIDEQFTEKAWLDMEGRLDKALPVKKSFFFNRWIALAAVFCLFCVGGYWFTSSNTNVALENINDKTTFEILANEALKVDKAVSDKKNKASSSQINSKPSSALKQLVETQTTQKLSKLEKTQLTPPEKTELQIIAENRSTHTSTKLKVHENNKPSVLKNRSAVLNNNPITTNLKHVGNSKSKPAKTNASISKYKIVENKSDRVQSSKPQKFNRITFNKKYNSAIELTKNLVPIDGNLHPSPIRIESTLIENQSSIGQFKSRKLITQKNNDEWLHPKTIHYGIKQGLSSDLTSESKIFAGALVDFNFGKRWFIELAPMYQFGAINKKLGVQYDVPANGSRDEDLMETNIGTNEEPDEIPETNNVDPIKVEQLSSNINTKDTILNSLKANGHYVAADLLLGYRISPRVETLLGISASRCFSNCPENTNASFRESNAMFNTEPFYNNWSLSPKVALRFALKPKLSIETFYAYNLIPAVKEEYQLTKTVNNAFTSNNYFSSNVGLAFVYKFN